MTCCTVCFEVVEMSSAQSWVWLFSSDYALVFVWTVFRLETPTPMHEKNVSDLKFKSPPQSEAAYEIDTP